MNTMMNTSTLKKTIARDPALALSLAASIGLHAIGLYFLISQPMILHHSLRSLFGLSTAAPEYLDPISEDLSKKSHIVEEVFEHILVLSPHLQQPFDLIELPHGMAIAPSEESLTTIAYPEREGSSQAPYLPLFQEKRETVYAFETEQENPIELLEIAASTSMQYPLNFQLSTPIASYDIDQLALPQENTLYIFDPMTTAAVHITASQEPSADAERMAQNLLARSFPIDQSSLEIETKWIDLDTSLGVRHASEHVPFFPHAFLSKMHVPKINIASFDRDLDSYLSPTIITAAEWNEDFDLDISFLPHPEGKGYIFSLTLHPNFDISQYSLKQEVLFILDRSVRKHQFGVFKRAVVKALSCLQPGDNFNVYILDKKMTRFNTKSVPVNHKTVRAAEYFLEKQSDDDLFSSGDIYSSLEKLLGEIRDDHVHTAILLTDGVSQVSSRKQQLALKSWLENNDKLSLYTAAVGQKNDLILLDLLSAISGGKLLWSDTHAAFPRRLAKLVLDLKDPVATDLVIDALPQHADTHITLTHSAFQSSVLFSHQPYVILGSIDKPGPFELIVQGRHNDQWIAIKKTVSFIDGSKGDRTLFNQWTSQKAQRLYAKFLNDGKSAHLKDAREILKKTRSELALE